MRIEVTKIWDDVEIVMPKELQSNTYSAELMKVQDLLTYPPQKITVFFTSVLWIDNLVMIHFMVLLKRLKLAGSRISFKIDIDSEDTEQLRFIKYLDDYGFIETMKDMAIEFEDNSDLASIEGVQRRLSIGNFEASEPFMPFEFFTKITDIKNYISRVTEKINHVFSNSFSAYEKESVMFKVSLFLQETLGNIFEHAYDNDPVGGVMIRFIHNPDEKGKKHRDYWLIKENSEASAEFRNESFEYDQLKNLAKFNPYRNESGMKVLEKYLQIFVVDAGKGILRSLGVTDKHEERNLLNDIFEKGRRSEKRRRRTNTSIGGLRMIYDIFCENENYISVKGEYSWNRFFCGHRYRSTRVIPPIDGVDTQRCLSGLAVIGYIDCEYSENVHKLGWAKIDGASYLDSEQTLLCDKTSDSHVDILDFRFSNWVDMSNLSHDCILCFVGKNMDKSFLSHEILNAVPFAQRKQKNLVIVDIPDREVMKYELIFVGMTKSFPKVILVTQKLKIAVFLDNGNKKGLQLDRKATNNFIKKNSDNIADSAYGLLRFVRKNDSELFWSRISDIQKEKDMKLFINCKVGWNLEGGEMNGYLDFEQACFDEKIRKLLEYQMIRISSLESNYFVSIDRFTEDLCENVNSQLKGVPEKIATKEQRIYLGSIFVTGTIRRDMIDDGETEKIREYYCLSHSHTPQKINALLLWPSQKLLDEWFGKYECEKKLSRLGRTSFLAEGGTDYFAVRHYKDIGTSVYLQPADMYQILQEDSLWSPRFMKIAHFDRIDYHDYILINVPAIFKKHYIESKNSREYIENNCFDYLFRQMYIALGGTDKVECNLNEKKKSEVINKIDKSDISEDQGVFVYLADYETIEIISKLEPYYSEETRKRIIPIAPVIRKRRAAALLVSPVLMENISDKINNLKNTNPSRKVRATIFIATVTSTRLQSELKHILYRLGADSVYCLSVIDRQRFPLGSRKKNSYLSFSRLDLPELRSAERCQMCNGISELRILSKLLISPELTERCDEIIKIWEMVKQSDSYYNSGVKVRTVDLSKGMSEYIGRIYDLYGIKDVTISTDIGLILCAIENMVITMYPKFLDRCLKESSIDDETKILLVAAHLMLFDENELGKMYKQSLLTKLYELLQKQKSSSPYTALACVVLAAQTQKIKQALHQHYKEKWKSSHFNNIDFIITSIEILKCADEQDQDPILRYWLKSDDASDYLYGIFLFTDGNSRTRHGTILSRMREVGRNFQSMDYISAYNDASFLQTAYREIPNSYLADPEQFVTYRKDMETQLGGIKELLSAGAEGKLKKDEMKELADKINAMFNNATIFNEELFMSTKYSLDKLRKKVQEIAKQVTDQYSLDVFTEYIEYDEANGIKYFCFPEDLRREIAFLIGDFRYADRVNLIEAADGYFYDGVIHIVFEEKYILYQFRNRVKQGFSLEKMIKEKNLKMNRPTVISLKRLLGEERNTLFHFSLDPENSQILLVELKMPYLHTYKGDE